MIAFSAQHGTIHCPNNAFPPAIPEELQATFAPARHLLYEWNTYYVEFAGADRLRVGQDWLNPISSGLFVVRFENQLGLAALQPFTATQALCPPLWIEVISRKFPTPAQHVTFLQGLIRDLFAQATQLPFTFHAPTARNVTEAIQPASPLFIYHFIAQHAPAITAALRTIQSQPHRVLHEEDQYVPLAEASLVDSDVLVDILQSPEQWVPTKARTARALRLHGNAPTHIWQRRPEESYDTPENRFVLAFLRELVHATDRLRSQVWWKRIPTHRQVVIQEVGGTLQAATHRSPFDQVGILRVMPASSQILIKQAGYREMRALWQLFQQARKPIFGALQHAIDVRDIANLYEMWVFFYLLEEISVLTGIRPAVDLRLSDEKGMGWNAQATFGAAGTLIYNQTFTRTSPYQSYSIQLRPDFIWVKDGAVMVVLDAKFRLDHDAWPIDATMPSAHAKPDDLYKMHAYRDALSVRAAVILYPGSRNVFYPTNGPIVRTITLQDVLFGTYAGIGALACRPNV